MDTYRKEIVHTLLFFFLYLLVSHTAVWALVFGIDNGNRVLGFPLHYFAAIALAWFGVVGVAIWWNVWADRLDAEITSSQQEVTHAESVPGDSVLAASAKGD
ncbi:MAG: hypothetical protein K2X43_02135 [Hyphomonadaceae bacterium]|nr:hypothetical protein [Hyphomonadaceae bacterium]